MTAAVDRSRLHLRDTTGRELTLVWPTKLIPKTRIPRLLHSAVVLRPVPTLRFVPSPEPSFLPGCAKPDRSSRGEGFTSFRSREEWLRCSAKLDASYVVQPLLAGREYRVTVCHSGIFAAAELLARDGEPRRWRDDPRFPREIVAELIQLVQDLRRAGVGFDVILADDGVYVLDVNLFPSLAIHADGEPPRRIASAFLRDWIALSGA